MSKLNISVSFCFLSKCMPAWLNIHPRFISILVENKPFFSLMNSISVCLLTKNVTLHLMDLTKRNIFQLFFYWRLWVSLPKLLWQWRGTARITQQLRQTELRPNKMVVSFMKQEKGNGKGSLNHVGGGGKKEEKDLLWALRNRRRKAAEGPILFCYYHFCFQIMPNWEGEGWALLIQKNSKWTSDISSLLRMMECNWCAWCLANSNFLRMPLNVRTLFLDYWTPENNELAFSFGE